MSRSHPSRIIQRIPIFIYTAHKLTIFWPTVPIIFRGNSVTIALLPVQQPPRNKWWFVNCVKVSLWCLFLQLPKVTKHEVITWLSAEIFHQHICNSITDWCTGMYIVWLTSKGVRINDIQHVGYWFIRGDIYYQPCENMRICPNQSSQSNVSHNRNKIQHRRMAISKVVLSCVNNDIWVYPDCQGSVWFTPSKLELLQPSYWQLVAHTSHYSRISTYTKFSVKKPHCLN